LIQEHLESRCNDRQSENPRLLRNARAFLDSERLADLGRLLDDLRRSKVVVILLSKGYFTRPWCLAELYAAFESNIPIVTINIAGGGYDRDTTVNFLSTLSPTTLDEVNPDVSKVLKDLGIDITELGRKLTIVIPQIIEINFNPNGTRNAIDAGIDDLIDRILLISATPFTYRFNGLQKPNTITVSGDGAGTSSSFSSSSVVQEARVPLATSIMAPSNMDMESAFPTAVVVQGTSEKEREKFDSQ
jgi:hypothetical protein